VLPFEDHSPNPEDAWFADGIQDDIRTALRGISGLSLRAQSSVDRFREERPPVRDLASILGVAFLIEGSARIIEDQVRVIVHLIDGQADEEVWSETYDTLFSMPAVTAIQGNIAHRVAREVGARIAPTEEVASATLPTEDLGAYRLIHQARVLWNQRRVPEIREAVGLYEEAIRRDSQYADAYAGLGEASLYLGIFSLDRGEQIDAFRRAVTASERALELSPQMGGPHAVLGGVDLWYEGNREGAEQELTTAIALEPDHAFAHYWYSMYLNSLGRHEEALRELSIAQRLDPLAQAMTHGPAKLYFHARDYDRAVAEALKDLEVNPDYNTTRFFLCLSYLKLGSLDKARDPCETAQERNQVGDPLVGLYHAVAGDEAAARREVERELEAYGRPTLISIDVFAVLGDIDEAIRVLRRMQELDPLIQIQLGVDPFLDPLRSDPRFIQILRDMGLEG
jgi:TolB-like protein/Flp pilus assembly protein TadD